MSDPAITTIVLCWNGLEDTIECLKSLREVDYPRHRVMVVDNGSTDSTPDTVRKLFPEVKVLQTGKNLGFAEGNNVGIRVALAQGADAVLLLNNDTTVDPGFLSALVETLYSSDGVGAVNPTIYYYDHPDVIWSAGGIIDWKTGISYQRHIGETDCAATTAEEVDYGVGAALLIRREALEAAGMLDPAFFLYYEETDWCCRARDAGFKTLHVPQAKVWHKISRSLSEGTSAQIYYLTRNRLMLLRRRRTPIPRLARVVAQLVRMSGAMAVRGERKQSRAVLRAVLDFCRGRVGKGWP